MEREIVYYYLRHDDGHPYGCVAIKENDDGTINRGVSLCSLNDKFVKATARGVAIKRLNDAEKHKSSTKFDIYAGAYQNMGIPILIGCCYFNYKSEYHVEPTKKEYRMLHKPDCIK